MTRRQDGAASLLVVSMLGLLLFLGSALGVVGAMVVAHRTAQSAADLSALAAARALADGGDACAAGASLATSNGAHLRSCDVVGSAVSVMVTVPGPHWLGQHADLAGRARAGPAEAGP